MMGEIGDRSSKQMIHASQQSGGNTNKTSFTFGAL
jgi:hypothetical protein